MANLPFPKVLGSIDDLSQDQIQSLLEKASTFKKSFSSPSFFLSEKPCRFNVCLFFEEDSTRTKMSFALAAGHLGIQTLDFNLESSSLKKGESFEETFKTFAHMGVDLCVIRTKREDLFPALTGMNFISAINAGDGTNEHPTQALLDLMTLQELSPNLKGKSLAIVGDLKHSRVARSLTKLLARFGVEVILVAPKELMPDIAFVPNLKLSHNFEETAKNCDFLYMLRVQKERHENSVHITNYKNYTLTLSKYLKFGLKVPVFHPGPVNVGVELDADLLNDKCYQGYRQNQNSVYMRMSLLSIMRQTHYELSL